MREINRRTERYRNRQSTIERREMGEIFNNRKPEPNTRNYQQMMENVIKEWHNDGKKNGRKPRLLLHSCCAPCSSAVLDHISAFFDITLFYYNPNISTKAEFDHRASELKRLVHEMGLDQERVDADGIHHAPISVLVPVYDHKEFLEIAKGHEKDPERGERCHLCYRQRLEKTADVMDQVRADHLYDGIPMEAFDYFCTTLTISPMKSSEVLNRIGEEIAGEHQEAFLPSDFKKKGGYQHSIALSREYRLYRQDFCGCEYSKAQAERERRMRAEKEEKQ